MSESNPYAGKNPRCVNGCPPQMRCDYDECPGRGNRPAAPQAPKDTKRVSMSIYGRTTPETDAVRGFCNFEDVLKGGEGNVVPYDHACRLEQERDALKDLLTRIHAWDMMDAAADGKYWRSEIDEIIRAIEERK